MRTVIPDAYEGRPLRDFLQGELRLSRRLITRLKAAEDGILLCGRPVTVRATLHGGDVLTLATEDAPDALTSVVPSGTLPPILYEDEYILLCNKPGNMPTHPSHGHFDDTLANAVAAYLLAKEGRTAPFRPVNRLDRQTSGIVLAAKDQLSAGRLSEQLREGRIQKTYLAILDGIPEPRQGVINAAIRRAEQSIITRAVCREDEPGAHTACTQYQVLADWNTADGQPRSLALAHPLTGRTHQLRVHFSHIGTPILGDRLYGRTPSDSPLARHYLHAHALRFVHPVTGQELTVRAPLPDDMAACLPGEWRDTLSFDSKEERL